MVREISCRRCGDVIPSELIKMCSVCGGIVCESCIDSINRCIYCADNEDGTEKFYSEY